LSKRILMFSTPKQRGGKLIDWYFCRCLDCQIRTEEYLDKAEARAAWNKRVGAQWTAEPPMGEGWYVSVWRKHARVDRMIFNSLGEPCFYHNGFAVSNKCEDEGIEMAEILWLKIPTPPLPGKEDTKDE